MSERELKAFIDKLNRNISNKLIFLRPITKTVDFAKVWTKKMSKIDKRSFIAGPFNFYFIKNNEGIYVAAVLDMGSNLHWFVLPRFRKQGHLNKALRESILFHLFQDRESQIITIDKNAIGSTNLGRSVKLALSLGFESKGDSSNEYILNKEKYTTDKIILGEDTPFELRRIHELKKHINDIAISLWIMQTEIEMKQGEDDFTNELNDLGYAIKRMSMLLEDKWHEKGSNKSLVY